jgi:hypothetical protein
MNENSICVELLENALMVLGDNAQTLKKNAVAFFLENC